MVRCSCSMDNAIWNNHSLKVPVQLTPTTIISSLLSKTMRIGYINKIARDSSLDKMGLSSLRNCNAIGDRLGHLGQTNKTKRMLQDRYWFPEMNMIDNAVDQCYECQVATKETHLEPIKTSSTPDNSWDIVSVDCGGSYPDGHYYLVIIIKGTRYPVVERVSSTSFQMNKERLKHMFATYETHRRLESANGAPFNSIERLANTSKYRRYTPGRMEKLHNIFRCVNSQLSQ